MKKEQELLREVTELIKETQGGRVHWQIQYQTSEYNDPESKPVEVEEGEKWTVDECFVSYHCIHQEKEFLLITYEQFYTCGDKTKSCNLIFLPPAGIRFFDVDVLAPYAIQADQMLSYEIHMLWLQVLEAYKKDPASVELDVTPRELMLS
ncbi:MAG: hypothetical protein PUA77_03035 [Lachnospiraceae bacterium]|nr:hypothetical protein [Lachnospiraceae bacterium]